LPRIVVPVIPGPAPTSPTIVPVVIVPSRPPSSPIVVIVSIPSRTSPIAVVASRPPPSRRIGLLPQLDAARLRRRELLSEIFIFVL